MKALVIGLPVVLAAAISLLLAFGTMMAADAVAGGDPSAGAVVYERCAACHSLAYDRAGPHHCGLLGRRAGSVEGYSYSDAMKASSIVWTESTLDRFLADPLRTVPGTSMGYSGIADPKERADLIAYLESAGQSEECRS
jgi:cytochrome c